MKRLRNVSLWLMIFFFLFSFFNIINPKVYAQEPKKRKIVNVLSEKERTEIIVKYKDPNKGSLIKSQAMGKLGLKMLKTEKTLKSNKVELLKIDKSDDINKVIKQLKEDPNVEYAQPNYKLQKSDLPQDPLFVNQWGLNNSGQVFTIGGVPSKGVKDLDINALSAWEINTGSPNVVVGVIDSGIDINHPDLAVNIYRNPGEIPYNNIDDDHNGYIDDVTGWDFYNGDKTVYHSAAEDDHGTHVAGIIAASKNSIGVVGVAPGVKILPLKFLGPDGEGYTLDVIEAIEYAKGKGIKIINCSWGSYDYNYALESEIRNSNMLFVCAAGNDSLDMVNSGYKYYPACFDFPNIISVAAVNNRGIMAPFSNYGSNIDVAAPGVGIMSTLPGNKYGYMDGTSMAAPFVTGIAALLKSNNSNISYFELSDLIKKSVVRVNQINNLVSTSGIVNANDSLSYTGELAFSLGYIPADIVQHPTEPILYMTSKSEGKLYSVNTDTREIKSIYVGSNPESLEFSDGKIYISLLTRGTHEYVWENQSGIIVVIDAANFTKIGQYNIDIDPCDIIAGRDEYLYILSGSDQWTHINSYSKADLLKKSSAMIRHGSIGYLNPMLDRIYTINTDISPRDYTAYSISNGTFTEPSYPGGYDSPYHGDYDLYTNFKISPDGKYLFNGTGIIFSCQQDKTQDMRYVSSLNRSFTDITFDLENDKFYICDQSSKIYVYNYTTRTQTGTIDAGINAKRLFFHNNSLAVISADNIMSKIDIGKNSLVSPKDLLNMLSDNSIKITWGSVAGSTGYEVEIGDQITDVGNNTSYLFSNLEAGSAYLIRVRAYNAEGPGPWSLSIVAPTMQEGKGTGLIGEYYDNPDLTNRKVMRVDNVVDFNWGGNPPTSNVSSDSYSIRWTGLVEPRYMEEYTFYTYANDGIRLWVNNQLIIDSWTNQTPVEHSGRINLTAGLKYNIKLEYYKNTNDSSIRLMWSSDSQEKEVIRQNRLYPNRWNQKADLPTNRTSFATVEINSKIYVIGGRDPYGNTFNSIEVFDPITNSWMTKAGMKTPRYNFGAAVVNGKIYVIGGENEDYYLNSVEMYDPVTNTWSTKANMPTTRTGLSVRAVNGKIYAIGGFTNAYDQTAGENVFTQKNKVEEYNPATNTWTTKANMPTWKRGFASEVFNGKIYTMSGVDDYDYSNTVEEFNPITNTWTVKASVDTARSGAGAAVLNNKIYLVGGENLNAWGTLYNIEEYDPVNNQWSKGDETPLQGSDYGIVASNGCIYAVGGHSYQSSEETIYNKTYEYAPAGVASIFASATGLSEGSEHLGKIIVRAVGSKFTSNGANSSTVTLNIEDLPEGISEGTVTLSPDRTYLTISLVGDSTVDYDANKEVSILISRELFENIIDEDLTTKVTFPATVETQPAAPNVTFSYNGTSAGVLVGSTITMEYSIDGGMNYLPVIQANMKLDKSTLEGITADKDLKIRVAQTFRAPAGLAKTINILPGPAAPNLTKNDVLNTVSGMTTTMEFSTDGGTTWTKYTGNNNPGLNGDVTLKVRVAGIGVTAPGGVTTLTYTVGQPLTVTPAFITSITEGAESGKIISLTLSNGEYIRTISSYEIVLSGLPAGISRGTVTRISNTVINIGLVGSSTVDYDTNQPINILIKKSQILPQQQDDINLKIDLPAIVEPAPAAPTGITFSFDGIYAGKLMGTKTNMEYSIDGGNSYTAVTTAPATLTALQKAGISAENNIRVRLKKTLRVPAGNDLVIDIQEGPALSGTIAANDETNSISGLTTLMEFSTNGGTSWTKYTGTNLPSLIGDVALKVRYTAAGIIKAGEASTFTFTSTTPELSIGAVYSGITEGQESGKFVTVTLINGSFAATVTDVQLTGLPTGVTRGSITKTSSNTIRITLTGNSTVDYDTAKEVTVNIGKTQVVPAQPASLTTTVSLPAIVESVPEAPTGITFSFDGIYAGKLIGTKTNMEYSIDGGNSYIPVTIAPVTLTVLQISNISAENDIRVRLKKTLRVPAGSDLVIDIQEGPVLPATIVANDESNSISGLTTLMEFSTDGGVKWIKYTGTNVPSLIGDVALKVRYTAAGMTKAGEASTFTFTSTTPELSIGAVYSGTIEGAESGKFITVTLTNGSFASIVTGVQLTGLPTGVTRGTVTKTSSNTIRITLTGNSTVDYDTAKEVTINIGKTQVVPAQPASLTTTVSLPAAVEPVPAAPTGITFSFDGIYAGKLMGTKTNMEYSIDGGNSYIPVTTAPATLTALQKAGITAENDIRVRLKKTLRSPAGEDMVIDIQ